MLTITALRPWALSIVIGLTYDLVIVRIWAILPAHNPITKWLLDTYARSNPDLHQNFVLLHDFIINVLLAIPFAFLILKIRPDRRWIYGGIAVLVVFALEYQYVLFQLDLLQFAMSGKGAFFGIVFTLTSLPIALLIMRLFERKGDAA